METGTREDARSSGDWRRGGTDEGLFNKCLSQFMGIDGGPSDNSYTGFNTDGTRASTADIPRAERVNTACKHIDVDLGRKQSPEGVRCDSEKTLTIFDQPQTTSDVSSTGTVSFTHEHFLRNVANCVGKENIYSKWPVKKGCSNRIVVLDRELISCKCCVDFSDVNTNEVSTFLNYRLGGVEYSTSRKCSECHEFAACGGKKHTISSGPYTSRDCVFVNANHILEKAKLGNSLGKSNTVKNPELSTESFDSNGIPSSVLGRTIALGRDQSHSGPRSTLVKDKSYHSSVLTSSHAIYPSITTTDSHTSSSSLPGTDLVMKPAKIGQLTPILDRSESIDHPESQRAGVHVLRTAQRAWLCDGSSVEGVGDGLAHGCHDPCEEGESRPVIQKKSKADARCSGVDSTRAPISSQLTLAIRDQTTSNFSLIDDDVKPNDSFNGSYESIDTQLADIRSSLTDARGINIDAESETKPREISLNAENDNNGGSFVCADNVSRGVDCVTLQQVTDAATAKRCNYKSQTPAKPARRVSERYTTASRGESLKVVTVNKPVAEKNNSCCDRKGTVLKPPLPPRSRVNFSLPNGDKLESVSVSDMNKKENHSVVYANFLHDNCSTSCCEDPIQQVQLCNIGKNDQILTVDPKATLNNRFSHQYLNSSVTGQNYPDVLPDSGRTAYPHCFTDTGLVDCACFETSPEMIFTATATKETSFTEKQPNAFKSSPAASPTHHYYNKSSIFQPLVRENGANSTSNNNCCKQTDEKNFTNFYPTNGNGHGNKRDQGLDLMLFPQLSQLHCPVHRSSGPLASPHQHLLHQQHHHPLHQHQEQQQLLSHFHPQHHENNFHRQQQQHNQIGQHHHRRCDSTTSSSSLIHHIKCGPHNIRLSPVSLLWTFLSVLVAGTCLLSFLTPYWTVHPDHVHSFGLFNLCVRDQRYSHPRPLCMNFGHQHFQSTIDRDQSSNKSSNTEADENGTSVDIARIPSGAWQAACLLFGAGVCVQILGAFVSLVVLALTEPWHHRIALVNGYMQTVGVLLLVAGLLLYPVGFSSPFFSYYCDSTRAFCVGHCAMGWSYVTAVMATALSIFCPVMSSFAEAQQSGRKQVTVVETASA